VGQATPVRATTKRRNRGWFGEQQLARRHVASEASPETLTNVQTVSAGGRVQITAREATMLANHLMRQLDRRMRDETGLGQRYDFVLTFAEGLGVATPADARDLSDLPAAVQEQLGLKIEARKGPVEMVVVDRVDRTPAGN